MPKTDAVTHHHPGVMLAFESSFRHARKSPRFAFVERAEPLKVVAARRRRGDMVMKIRYDREAEVLYRRLTDKQIRASEETETGVIVDFDAGGNVVGMEFLKATDVFAPKPIERFEAAA